VVLEAEKGSPRYRAYEFKGDEFQFPAFLIRELPTRKVLGRVPWPGDAGSDEQPLSASSAVLWSPDGNSVALNTTERYYAHTTVWTIDRGAGVFVEVGLPEYETLTGFEKPDSNDLRPRGCARIKEWTPDSHLVYELMFSPEPDYDGADSMHHEVTLRIAGQRMEVLSRKTIPRDD